MKKEIPILGSGKYTLMLIEDSVTENKGIEIVNAERFNTFGQVGDRPNIEHINTLDENIDNIICFENLKGLKALISELELLKLRMQLEILEK